MKTVINFNVLLLILAVIIIATLMKIRKSNIGSKTKLIVNCIGIIVLICVTLAIFFVDAILFGIIGPVPN